MAVGVPDSVFLTITGIQVRVYDEVADCARIRALGGSVIDTFTLSLGLPETVRVTTGIRTFEAVALQDEVPVAQGCVTEVLTPDADNIVALELLEIPSCGSTLPLPIEIDLNQLITGTTEGQGQNFDDGGCSTVGGPEVVYAVLLTQDLDFPLDLHVTNDYPGTEYDAVHHARTSCLDDSTNIACSDSGPGDDLFITVDRPRTIYVVIDSHDGDGGGPYEFSVDLE